MVNDPVLGELTLHSELMPRRVLKFDLTSELEPYSQCRLLRADFTSELEPHSSCRVQRVDIVSGKLK